MHQPHPRHRSHVSLPAWIQIVLLVLSLVGATALAVLPASAGKGGGTSGGTNLGAKIEGFDNVAKTWSPGNTGGWAELEKIPFRLVLTGTGTITSLTVLADHERAGVPGIEDLHDFRICSGAPTRDISGATGCSALPLADLGGAWVSRVVPNPVASGVTQVAYTFHDIVVNKSVVLLWGAELALGSHNYNGSALHMAIGAATAAGGSLSFGSKDVPIPVNAIIATETDKTINGQDTFTGTVGQVVRVTITATAFGPAKASQNLEVRDELPACLDYLGNATPTPTTVPPPGPGGTVTWIFNGVKNGTTRTASFDATIVSLGDCVNIAFTRSLNTGAPESHDEVPISSLGRPDVVMAKDCDDVAAPGGLAHCTLRYRNAGTAASGGIVLTDVLDARLAYEPGSGSPAPSSITTDPGGHTVLKWNVAGLAAGAEGSVSYSVRIPATGPPGTTTYTNTATAFTPDDSDPGNDEDTETIPVTYVVDLSVAKTCPTAVGTTPQPGSITYANAGTAAATGVTVVDTLPAGMSLANASPAPSSVSGNTVTWNVGTVAAGTGPFTITFTLTATGTPPFTNQVAISADQPDADASDNQASCSSGLNYSDVTVSKDCGSGVADPGALLTHTVDFGNNGNQASGQVVVTDTLGAGLTRTGTPTVSGSAGVPTPVFNQTGQVMTWTFSSLPAHSSGTITYQVRVASTWPTAGVQSLSDSVSITGVGAINPGDDTSSCSTLVSFQPHLELTKVGCRETVVPLGYQTYLLTYRNTGSAPATNVKLVDTPPANQPIASAPGASIEGNTATWTLGTLGPDQGGSQSLTVEVQAADGALLTNEATITADQESATATASTTTVVSSEGAETSGEAYSLEASLLGLVLVPRTLSDAASSAPGGPADSASGASLSLLPGIIDGGLLVTTSSSRLLPGEARTISTTSVANLGLLGGLITSKTVVGVTQSTAGPFGAESSTIGSTFENLRIGGVLQPATVPPNTVVSTLPGIRVTLNESVRTAALVDGKYTTTASVNMIHVEVLTGLLKGVEIVVGHSSSKATYPSGQACGTEPNTVLARAYTAHVDALSLIDVWLNRAEITPLGGSDAADAAVAGVTGILAAGAVTNRASGSIGEPPTATARSTIANANVLAGLVRATVLDVKSTSKATGTSASTVFETNFVDLVVAGLAVNAQIGPNSVINVPWNGGIAHIVLNEQFALSDGARRTIGTVNAVHVQLFNSSWVLHTDVVLVSAKSGVRKGG